MLVETAMEVARGELVRPIELEAPLVLPVDVGAAGATIVKLDMVINAPVVNERPLERPPIGRSVPLTPGHILRPRQKLIHRYRVKELCGKGHCGRPAWPARASP